MKAMQPNVLTRGRRLWGGVGGGGGGGGGAGNEGAENSNDHSMTKAIHTAINMFTILIPSP